MAQHWVLLGVIALAICLDQGSKAAATATLSSGRSVSLLRGVDLRLRQNPGGGWGLGATLPEAVRRILFPAAGLVVGAGLFAFAWRLPAEEVLRRVAIGLVIGGGAGNVVDRLRLGAVTDFIGLQVGSGGWSMSGTFNLADLWVVAGLVVLALFGLRRRKQGPRGIMDDGGTP